MKRGCLACTPCWPKTLWPPKSSGDAMFDSVLTCPQANLTRRRMPALLFLTFKPAAVSFLSLLYCYYWKSKAFLSEPSSPTQLDSGTMRINESCKVRDFYLKFILLAAISRLNLRFCDHGFVVVITSRDSIVLWHFSVVYCIDSHYSAPIMSRERVGVGKKRLPKQKKCWYRLKTKSLLSLHFK